MRRPDTLCGVTVAAGTGRGGNSASEPSVSKACRMSTPTEFIVTKEYRRFAEFCDACRESRYIALCHELAGLGKQLSAIRCHACEIGWLEIPHRLLRARAAQRERQSGRRRG
jgi:hypothetical protein